MTSNLTEVLSYLAPGLVALSLTMILYALSRNEPEDSPRLGARGLKRQRALREGGLFTSVEPAMRFVASWVAYLPMRKTRRNLEITLKHSGYYLGLTANEFIALMGISALMSGIAGIVVVNIADIPQLLIFFFLGLGAFIPYSRVTSEIQKRFKEVNRSLPGAIDLASLCMGAGLDFPGSLRQIVSKSGQTEDALIDEFRWILQELDLGRTRRLALTNFADRVPTEAVQEFVGAVVQSEEKGNPLAEVLRIQAEVLRTRRSIKAEELASRAGVMMLGPLMLIFASIILILLGPFVLNSMASGF